MALSHQPLFAYLSTSRNFFRDSSTKNHCVRDTNVWNCNQKVTGFFAITVGVTSGRFEVLNKKDQISIQRALEVEEVTWTEGEGVAAGAKSTWDRGSKDARAAYVEDAVTAWGFVDCDVALDAAVVGI